jgi:uncharacterized protein (TIGR03437 family)
LKLTFLIIFAFAKALAGAPTIKVSPAALVFTYQEGSATLPAAQTLAITAASGAPPSNVYTNSGSSPWLAYSPLQGKVPLSIRVSVNPTTLPIGQYSETIVLATPETGGDSVSIPITLTVKAPPSDLRVSPTTLAMVYRLGESPPAPVFTYLQTTGGLLSYSAASTGAKWMRVTPASGAVFPGFRSQLSISADVAELVPGTQKGTLTITSTDAITKSSTVTVNLTVQPGQPVASYIWPPRVTRGAPDTTVTITGERFFSGTVVKCGTATLRSTVLGPTSLSAVVPSGFLASPGAVSIVVSNPDPGGGAAQPVTLEVLPPGPLLLSVVNAASQRTTSIVPGSIFTLYGTGLGPDTLVTFDGSSPYLPTEMAGTRVYFDGNAAPIIYTSARQVSIAVSSSLESERPFMIEVEYNGVRSSVFPVISASAAPGIFTTSGTGTGNAAAFQVDPVKGDFTLNSDKTPATKGSILVLYATGIAPIDPVPPDGFVALQPSPTSIPGVTVMLGDSVAEVLYAGFSPGLVTGITQINARVPETTPTGKAVPLVVRVNNVASQPGVTLNIK